MPNSSATARPFAWSRDASASSLTLGASIIAGMTRSVAIAAAPRTPQFTLAIRAVSAAAVPLPVRRVQLPAQRRLAAADHDLAAAPGPTAATISSDTPHAG